MFNSQISNNKGMAKWLDDFVSTISKNKKVEAEEKIATINLNDLPKISWKDETFLVQFVPEKSQAKILNSFGNEVTTVDNVTSIEDVDKVLNGSEIVASNSNDFINELERVAEEIEIPVEDPTVVEGDDQTTEQQVEDIEKEIEETGSMLNNINEVNNKIAELEQTITGLSEQVKTLNEQLYARQPVTNPAQYDIGVENAEKQHFDETSKATADQISADNAIDITTPAGRVSLKDRLMGDINNIINDTQTPEVSDSEVSEFEQVMSYDLGETAPEEFDNPDLKDYVETDKKETETPEVPVETSENETEEVKPEEPVETTETEEEKKDIVKLNAKDARIFKRAICPNCGDIGLTKTTTAGIMLGVYCSICNAEYAVNTENEDIYHKFNG